jgi:predicted permease
MLSTFLQDIRFALRQLRKTPGFTTTAVLTLALGIGANAAIFTLVNALMLKNLPVSDPTRLVRLGKGNDCCVGFGFHDNGEFALFSTKTYEVMRKNIPEFDDLAAIQAGFTFRPVVVRRENVQEAPRSVMGEFVSGNYFRTFGLMPESGRLLTDADDIQGTAMTAVLSYNAWKTMYGGDPSIVGSTVRVNTQPVTVIGIAPQRFFGDRIVSTPPDFYLPIESMPVIANVPYVHGSDMLWLYMIGRLKPGVTEAQLKDKVNTLLRQSMEDSHFFESKEDKAKLARAHVVLTPGGGGIQAMQEEYKEHLQMLMWASGLVLLIACANIANLLLVRGMTRRMEMSVRTALGAMRSRIVRQLLTESVLLAALGGLAGLAVAYAGTRMLLALAFPDATALPIAASPSPLVLAFAVGLSLLTGVLFGVAPAWIAARAEPADALRTGSRTISGGASILQKGLVVLQAGLSLVLLVGAGLFTESLGKLQHTNLKLDSRNRYIVHINPQSAGYGQKQVGELYRMIEERFHGSPGVEKVGIASYSPMEDDNTSGPVRIQGKEDPKTGASFIRVSPEYMDSVGTKLLTGRGIEPRDTAEAPHVALVNETFVKKLFKPGENPVGHHFGFDEKSADNWEIAGVVQDTVYTSARWKDHLIYFVPLKQRFTSDKDPIEKDDGLYVGVVVLKTNRPIEGMEAIARKTLADINPNLSVVKFQTFDAQIQDQFIEDRMLQRLTMLFGLLALLLATLGMYGVTAYSVARRTAEIGIRMALGAERTSVTAMVMKGALLQAAVGLAIGIPVAFLCVRFVKAQLYEVSRLDPMVLGTAIATLALAALVAGLIPARRAASIEPARALRTE